MAPGTTRAPPKSALSGILSWKRKSPALDSTMSMTLKDSRIARLARSSTTTSSVAASTNAARAVPASMRSTASTTALRASESAGLSSARRSHSSSITAGIGEAKS